MGEGHLPVLVDEVLASLDVGSGSSLADCTVGGGGHAERLLEASSPDGRLLGLDADRAAIAEAQRVLARFGDRAVLRQANFEELYDVAASERFMPLDGVLFDLGLSSYQLADPRRGFSFAAESAPDMRFDEAHGLSALDLIDRSSQRELAAILGTFGEERRAGRIAKAILAARAEGRLVSAADLAQVVARAVPARGADAGRIHPATRTFQALRMHVNDELGQLRRALDGALQLLDVGGRLAVISFHSLEDRIVKQFIQSHSSVDPVYAGLPVIPDSAQPRMKRIGSKTRAGEAELAANPRARSSVLRVATKVRA